MILGIVMGSLFLLCTLALSQRVRITLAWEPGTRSVEIRYAFLRFRIPRHKERAKRKKRRRAKRIGRRSTLQWLKLVPELVEAVWKGLKFLLRRSELRRMVIEGSVGAGDPAMTGILWGEIQAAYGVRELRVLELAIVPDFADGTTNLRLDAEGAVRLGAILTSAVVVLWRLPKRKLWRLLRERRRRKASPNAGLKSNPNKEVVTA